MKETPLLMCGEMVRATLEGRKTNTRRVIKYQFHACLTGDCAHSKQTECDAALLALCPYGVPGDRLWVRETFYCDHYAYPEIPTPEREQVLESMMYYAADGDVANQIGECEGVPKLKPSIFMPRWASRISLEVVSVRVQRVQDISEEDAVAEGVQAVIGKRIHGWAPHVLEFSLLWDSINAKRAEGNYAWSANPYVWAITFKRV